jgi:HEPN domain-containing protein
MTGRCWTPRWRRPSWASTREQACEKLLKALLTEAGCEYPRPPNLAVLKQLAERHDQALPALALVVLQLSTGTKGVCNNRMN